MTQSEFDQYIVNRLNGKKPAIEGMIEGMEDKVLQRDPATKQVTIVDSPQKDMPLGKRIPPVWIAIDIRFDYCVGSMHALPYMHSPETSYSVHFSCLQHIEKPSKFYDKNEGMMMAQLFNYADGYARYWILKWYEVFQRAYGKRFPEPHYQGPAVPGLSAQHDEFVQKQRQANPNHRRRSRRRLTLRNSIEKEEDQEAVAMARMLEEVSPLELERAKREGYLNDYLPHSHLEL
jgi:hypothetical protein